MKLHPSPSKLIVRYLNIDEKDTFRFISLNQYDSLFKIVQHNNEMTTHPYRCGDVIIMKRLDTDKVSYVDNNPIYIVNAYDVLAKISI